MTRVSTAMVHDFPGFRIEDGDSIVELVPERGAIVTRFDVGGEPVLFLDEATLVDRTKNVRGGIPVLFPIAGRLPDDRWTIDAKPYELKQHGFARTLPWTAQQIEDVVRCTLVANEETRRGFPFDFEARYSIRLRARTLTLEFELANQSARPMPFHLGYHPYFHVPAEVKAAAQLETDALHAWDNVSKAETEVGALDFSAGELDLHLLDHHPLATALLRPGLRDVRLRWNASFRVLVVWTLLGRDFVCVEPWTARAGALASGAPVEWIQPGKRATTRVEIEAA